MEPYDFYIAPEEYQIAARFGIRPNLLETRIRSLGWPKKRAMTEPPQQKRSRIPREIIELAERNGINYYTLRYRVHTLGWDIERAATQPLQNRKEQAKLASEASRKYPADIVELAKKNGIQYDTFRRRVRSGWDMMRAATTPPMTPREIGLMTKEKRQAFFLRNKKSPLKSELKKYSSTISIPQRGNRNEYHSNDSG